MNKGSDIEGLFCNVDTIVCDEAHYFYADSDFNGSGTFTLLQAIVYAGMKKTIIFMSATMEKVSPLADKSSIQHFFPSHHNSHKLELNSASIDPEAIYGYKE